MTLSLRQMIESLARFRVNAKASLRVAARRLTPPRNPPVVPGLIVSFTSIPPRARTLHLVIDSLLLQTVLPERIVLYLSRNDFPDRSVLQKAVARTGERFEIRWLDTNLRSYRKLVHALEEFPGHSIVTVDDDKIYAADALESLVETAKRYPGTIVFRGHSSLLPRNPVTGRRPRATKEPSLWNLPVGAGGVLYPPDSLASDVTDSELFLALSPYADDLWFKTMALLKRTLAVPADPPGGEDHSVFFRWKESLSYENMTLAKQRGQNEATFRHYGIVIGENPGDPSRVRGAKAAGARRKGIG